MLRSVRPVWVLSLALLLFVYLRWLGPAVAPYAGGSDPSGYMWSARLFRQGTLSVPINVPKGFPLDAVGLDALTPLGGRVRPQTLTLVAVYPTGLPLHFAAASLILEDEQAVKAVLLFVVAGVLWLLYLLGRDAGLPRLWAAAGCLLLALSPLFLFLAVQPYSDVLATFWVEAAVICAWRVRRRAAFAVLAGASLGMAALVRPTNLLFLLPVLAAMPVSAGTYARLIGGGLPFAVFVAVYQTWAYGHPLRTGYGDVSWLFGWANVLPSLKYYLVWLPQLASWLVVLVPAAAWGWRGPLARWRLVAGAWLVANLGTYAGYSVTWQTWWFLRFVLPAFPILIVSGLSGLRELTQAVVRPARVPGVRHLAGAAAAVIVGLCAIALVRTPLFDAHRAMKGSERVYRDALRTMEIGGLSSRPVLMMQLSGAANYYRPALRFLRYDFMSPAAWQAIRRWQAVEHVAIGAAVFDFELDALFRDDTSVFPCLWQVRGRFRNMTFWECPP